MKLSKIDIISIILIFATFIVAFIIYPSLPEKIPTHWNINGEIDGYSSKLVGVLIVPITLAIIYTLFFLIPKIDPLKKNIESFIGYFEFFKLFMVLFFIAIYVITLLPNFGIVFNMTFFIVPAMAVLFYYIGYILQFMKRNYFIGIRTPWTLASDKSWEKTHKIGSITFRINAVIILLALINPLLFFWIFIISILLNVVFLVVYSYYVWKKEKD
jgi:uncharacterized membrane protein